MFGRVGPPWWDDKRVCLIGGGPSLRGFPFERFSNLEGHVVVGVNQSIFDLPNCSAGISMDLKFIDTNVARLAAFAQRAELFLAVGDNWFEKRQPIPKAIYLRNANREGLSLDSHLVCCGGTSGYVALSVAVLKHARTIVLFGYDYSVLDGRHHYHDAYPWFHQANAQSFAAWAKHYNSAALVLQQLGVCVINASWDSAISCFPKCMPEGALLDGRDVCATAMGARH